MSDLFHEKLSDDDIAVVFGIMALSNPRHTFQVLTKRPQRMLNWCSAISCAGGLAGNALATLQQMNRKMPRFVRDDGWESTWPLPNVWLGVSVENQATADERIPLLLQAPAAVRFVSYEPAIGPADFSRWLEGERRLSWLIAGGESGPGARPFHIEWARSVVHQCRSAGVPVFVKQFGSRPYDSGCQREMIGLDPVLHFRDRKGGDTKEWPESLRVREFPDGSLAQCAEVSR